MKSIYPTTLIALALPLSALSFVILALPTPPANASTAAADLCLKMAKTRIMTTADKAACQEKISNSTFDAQAVGVCNAMMDLRISTQAQIFSCLDAIRDKTYANGTDVCLMMLNSFATTGEITQCLANSGKSATPSNSSVASPLPSLSLEIQAIDRALSRIDAALYQLDADGANASTQYAVDQLLKAKSELQKMKARFKGRT